MLRSLPLAAVACLFILTAASPSQLYYAAIVGDGLSAGAPIVTDIVNMRVPGPTQNVHIVVEPKAASTTSVRWSSPDGKNAFAAGGLGIETPVGTYETSINSYVGVYPHGRARGGAIIIADIGAPVNLRTTFYVRDEIGVGFGCYGFIASGPSLRIVNGIPERATLAQADVAVVGPGNKEGTIPGYGCWGENYGRKAKSYKLLFNHGGRVLREHLPHMFVNELPYDAIDAAHPLDILASDGQHYRLHLTPAAGTYFTGWIEPIDDQGNVLRSEDLPS